MKRSVLAWVLVLVCALAVPVTAQTTGNIASGAFVEAAQDMLFVASSDGIYKMAADGTGAVKISEDAASMLQYVDGYLYYCQDHYEMTEYDYVEIIGQTPKRMLTDGTGVETLGETREVGFTYNSFDDSSDVHVDTKVGYRDFTVSNGYIYYMGNTDEGGEYTCTGPSGFSEDGEGPMVAKGVYAKGIALFRMKADGTENVALTGVLGNAVAHCALENDRLYVCAGYADVIYAYNFVNYAIYDLNGNVISTIHKPADEVDYIDFSCDKGEFYHNTQTIQPYGTDGMLVSLGESEGDFMSSQAFFLASDGTLTLRALEFNYTPANLDNGALYYLGTAAEDISYTEEINYDDSLGVYVKALESEGLGEKLFALHFDDSSYGVKINVVDGYVYTMNAEGAYMRVPVSGGASQTFDGSAFV